MAINTSLNTPYVVLTSVVIVAIAFLFAILQPLMDSINETRVSIESHTALVAEKERFLQSLDFKIAQLQSQRSVEQQLAIILPETERSQDILRVIDQYAKESGVTITTLTNNSSKATARTNADKARGESSIVPEGIEIITLQLNATGAYQQMRAFLAGLEKSPRIIDIKSIAMNRAPGQIGNVSASFTLQLYARAEEDISL